MMSVANHSKVFFEPSEILLALCLAAARDFHTPVLFYAFNLRRIRNPRFSREFSVTMNFGNEFVVTGTAVKPSAFGASVIISESAYDYLKKNPSLWENEKLFRVRTALNDLPATINSLYRTSDGKLFCSLKLMQNRSWYQ